MSAHYRADIDSDSVVAVQRPDSARPTYLVMFEAVRGATAHLHFHDVADLRRLHAALSAVLSTRCGREHHGLLCTRDVGHDGGHETRRTEDGWIVQTWFDEPDPPRAPSAKFHKQGTVIPPERKP